LFHLIIHFAEFFAAMWLTAHCANFPLLLLPPMLLLIANVAVIAAI